MSAIQASSSESPQLTVPVSLFPFEGQQMLMRGANWNQYVAWDEFLEKQGQGRAAFLDGTLEIMTTSVRHEQIKEIIGHLIAQHCLDENIPFDSSGNATLRSESRGAGKEPDGSWWFQKQATEGVAPDLVFEIVITSEAIGKQEFYANFGVQELWIWKDGIIRVYQKNESEFQNTEVSQFLPGLDLKLVASCTQAETVYEAIRQFREGL